MHHLLLLVIVFGWILFLFLTWRFALPLYLIAVIVTLAIYWKILKAQRQAPAMGEKAMVGQTATVVKAEDNGAEVEYEGEIWRAISSEPLQIGQPVIIKSVEGLVLRIGSIKGKRGRGESDCITPPKAR